ncbi:hypothetical protein [Listeria booriae]|uniref:hypothetical protein n=1 Tax=Listeria booriae TaxID=1552123 RepID=UPI001628B77C|nr:hypothetical protein [Listeria booriae]MBC1235482.1 hypothetical protein [Listeria booriae]MBC1248194.1 hypothetical protein [Listeria booriae]MBC1274314.1 hypothetical protein [Listeria booriae]
MADIKDLNIFGNRNKGLAQIKKAAQQKKASDKENEVNLPDTDAVETETKTKENEAPSPTPSPENIEREEAIKATNESTDIISNTQQTVQSENPPVNPEESPKIVQVKRKNKKGAGAPVRNFDRVHVASQPVKLSAILNSTSRILSEKYLTQHTRDEILRIALDYYIKVNFTKEDKRSLINDITKELALYREKNPTIPQTDEHGNIIQSTEEIEAKTMNDLKKSWG